MGPKKKLIKRLTKKPKKKIVKKAKKAKAKGTGNRSRSRERKERIKKANVMAKQHKQKLLDAKMARQRQRNRQMMRMRRKIERRTRDTKKDGQQNEGEEDAVGEEEALLLERHMKEDSCFRRFWMRVEDALAGLLYFLTVTLRSERTFDWLVFLANNLGLFQEYEINDYGQRLSPRTGRPVLLSLGPFRVVQVVESANQVRTHWDPYIREYLRNSKMTTDCWRANRMALQVALCMDEWGNMYDMPIHESAMRKRKRA